MLLLLATPSIPASVSDTLGEANRDDLFSPYFDTLKALLLDLNNAPNAANFNDARQVWEQISWLHPVYQVADDQPVIDNNSHWLLVSTTRHSYPEAGVWQQLEAQTMSINPDTEVIKRLTFYITSYLQLLQEALNHQPPSIDETRFLLATEVYRQYTLTLSGHHRLDSGRVTNDFVAFLTGLQKWTNQLNLLDKTGDEQLVAALLFCQGAAFSDLDRYTLYRHHLRPLYQSLLQSVPIEKSARKYGIAAAADGELFSSAFMDPVTISYSTNTAELGKLLFFDPLLSGNNRRSCASCHQPSKAYSDGRITSMAYDYPNRIDRNSPSLINTITGHGASGMDLEKPSVRYFIQSVFDHPQEMNARMDSIVNRLNRASGYRTAFANAFPKTGLDSISVLTALEAYILTLRGVDGVFDRQMRAEADLSDSATIRGYNLFMGKGACGSCHFPPYFDGRKPPFYRERNYQSAGRSKNLKNRGMGSTLQNNRYDYFFRIPGLRNLSYSAPYGHDGYFITLRSFMEDHHQKEQLSSVEMAELLRFMSTLNDSLELIDITDLSLPQIDGFTSEKNRRPAGLY